MENNSKLKLILGTVQFGLLYGINNQVGKPKEEDVFNMLHYASQNGISILDTADAYGNASQVIGKFHQQYSIFFNINTKFTISKISIMDQIENSLNKLKVDKINTYFYHNFQDFVTNKKSINELIKLREKNLIEKIGVSVYDNSEFRAAIDCKDVDVIQLPFNLLDNVNQRKTLLQSAKKAGKEIQARSVFLQGLFFMPVEKIPNKLHPLLPLLKEIRNISEKYQIPIEHIALQYVLMQELIDYVIIGIDTIEQLKSIISLTKKRIPLEIVELINNINVKDRTLLYPKNWS